MEVDVVIHRWFLQQPDELHDQLQSLMDSYLYKGILIIIVYLL